MPENNEQLIELPNFTEQDVAVLLWNKEVLIQRLQKKITELLRELEEARKK